MLRNGIGTTAGFLASVAIILAAAAGTCTVALVAEGSQSTSGLTLASDEGPNRTVPVPGSDNGLDTAHRFSLSSHEGS